MFGSERNGGRHARQDSPRAPEKVRIKLNLNLYIMVAAGALPKYSNSEQWLKVESQLLHESFL